MPSLDTTNWILGVMAVTSAAQFLMLLVGAIWVARRIAALQDTVTKTIARFEADLHLSEITTRVSGFADDVRRVAERLDRVGKEVERATHIAQGALSLAGAEVERATRGVRMAFDAVEGGVRQAARVGAGVRAGIRELFSRRTNGLNHLEEESGGRHRAVRSEGVSETGRGAARPPQSHGAAALNQLDQHRHDGEHQQQVDEAAQRVRS